MMKVIMNLKLAVYEKFFSALLAVAGDQNGRLLCPVMQGPAKGLWFRIDPLRRIEKAYPLGFYDSKQLSVLSKVCQPGWTIWDCGTYLGFYTTFFAKLVGAQGTVVAFEPDPRNLARTQDNVALNKLTNAQYHQVAIGHAAGTIEFILSDNSNSHLPGHYIGATAQQYALTAEQVNSVIQVPCISLDQAYANSDIPKPNLIKLDIEGAEKAALENADQLIREVHPLWLVELHNPQSDAALWQFAAKYGYILWSTDTGQVATTHDEVHGTFLCIPQRSPEILRSINARL